MFIYWNKVQTLFVQKKKKKRRENPKTRWEKERERKDVIGGESKAEWMILKLRSEKCFIVDLLVKWGPKVLSRWLAKVIVCVSVT